MKSLKPKTSQYSTKLLKPDNRSGNEKEKRNFAPAWVAILNHSNNYCQAGPQNLLSQLKRTNISKQL